MPNREDRLKITIQFIIAHIDKLLSKQLNAIIHHPEFQELEAGWRGLLYLVEQSYGEEKVKIRILDLSFKELSKDLFHAIEFDQSQLFKKVYGEEFDQPGGEPFGLLIGNYSITHRPTKKASTGFVDNIEVLARLSKVAAAAFSPIIMSICPSLFGLDSFSELSPMVNLRRIFQQSEYLSWNRMREEEDIRFIGLVLPKVLMRLPYCGENSKTEQFCFSEDMSLSNQKSYLWGSAAYCFATIVVRSFASSGWFAEIRGVEQDKISHGVVSGLSRDSFGTDDFGVAFKSSVDINLTSSQEKELSDLGFISLRECQYTDLNAFYSCVSLQRPKAYDRKIATTNAKLSIMLNYLLCISRFAHYVKIIVREKIGAFTTAAECEQYIQDWFHDYVAEGEDMPVELQAKYPLKTARIQVRERKGKVGTYLCMMHLQPRYQLERLDSTLSLVTEFVVN